MEQYISKAALVAKIENLVNTYKKCPTRNSYEEGLKEGRLIGYKDALHKIKTLEVKEVDLNEEIEKCLKKHNMLAVGKKDFTDIAKHFFELGFKAQKGE